MYSRYKSCIGRVFCKNLLPVCGLSLHSLSSYFFLRFLKFIFREKEREREREGEKHQCVVASHVNPLGTRPTTQACALMGTEPATP